MRKNFKTFASLMTGILLLSNTAPFFASDIAMTGDSATGNTPTEFSVDADAMGGGLTVQIPASLELTKDDASGNYIVSDVVSAYGNMNPSKKLQVSTGNVITYENQDDTSITINGAVAFGAAGTEEWTAEQTKASMTSLDSRTIGVTVNKDDVQYVGTYQTVVNFNIQVVDAQAATGAYTVVGINTVDTIDFVASVSHQFTVMSALAADVQSVAVDGNTLTNTTDYTVSDGYDGSSACVVINTSALPSDVGSHNVVITLTGGEATHTYTITEPITDGTYVYNLQDDGTLAVKGFASGASVADVVIPASYDGKAVTAVNNGSFMNNTNITSVTLPDSVTVIGMSAFLQCTNLTSVTLSDNITDIGVLGVFASCTNLTSVTYQDVDYTSRTELVNALAANGVTVIQSVSPAFSYTGLTE